MGAQTGRVTATDDARTRDPLSPAAAPGGGASPDGAVTRRVPALATAALTTAATWDRQHWVDLADALLAATEPHLSPGRALVHLPGPVSASGRWSDGLEGFARTFFLAALRIRGADGDDPHGLLDRFAEGLRHGTDPASPERWPRIPERRQAVVEAASIAVGLSETRPWLWDRLDASTQERVVAWLGDIVGTSGYRNNWTWFQVVVETFLAQVGGPWDQTDLDRCTEIQESLYVGDGWYSDGRGRDGRRQSYDWYAGWAWHLYPLMRARMVGEPLETHHAERLHAYLGQAQHLVGADGAPLLQGRSVTYRWGMLAPFWAGALAGATPLAAGQTRTLASAVAEHFVSRGAVDDDGLLSVGWHGRFERVRQLYTGGGSTYWASKGFLGLLLPADHDVWTAEPAVPDAWQGDAVTLLPAPGWIVSSTVSDGIVRVHNHGSDRMLDHPAEPRADDPWYRRQGYSTVTSPQLSPDAIVAPVESHVALLDGRGRPSHRDGIVRVRLDEHAAVSRSRVHWLDLPGAGSSTDGDGHDAAHDAEHGGDASTWASRRRGPTLTTASVVRGPHEVRIAWWDAAPEVTGRRPDGSLDDDTAWPHDPGPWHLRVGGWALAADELDVESGPGWVRVVRGDGVTSTVRSLLGLDDVGSLHRSGADPLGARSATPWAVTAAPLAEGQPCAALVTLSGRTSSGDTLPGRTSSGDAAVSPEDASDVVRVAVVGTGDAAAVEVRWHDGAVDVVELRGLAGLADPSSEVLS